MAWRYQPVWGEDTIPGGKSLRWYSLCEVYFDGAGRLNGWTEDSSIKPIGNDPDDLRGALAHMLADAWKWRPVKFSDLKVGMKFERAITQEQAARIATTIESMTGDAAEAAKAVN